MINTRQPGLKLLPSGRYVKKGWTIGYTRVDPLDPIWSDLPAGSAPWTSWPL